MTNVARLSGDLTLNTGRWETGLRRANSALGQSQRQWKSALGSGAGLFDTLGRSAGNAIGQFNSFKGALAGFIGGAGLTMLSKQSLDAAGALADVSSSLGVTAEDFQKYVFGAQQAGVSAEKLQTALTFLNNRIAEGEVPYTNLNQAMADIADRIAQTSDGAERAGIASENFGAKLGSKLIPFLENGSKGLRDIGAEAEKFGAVIDNDTIRRADEFGDKMGALGTILQTNFQRGFLAQFVSESASMAEIYKDPQLAEGMQLIGEVIGSIAAAALKGASALKTFYTYTTQLAGAAMTDLGLMDRDVYAALTQEAMDRRAGKGSYLVTPPGSGEYSGAGSKKYQKTKGQKSAADKNDKAVDSILDGLRRESMQLEKQVELYGQKQSVIDRALKAQQLNFDIQSKGLKLTEAERKQAMYLLDDIQNQASALEELEKQTKATEEAERNRQQALQQLAYTFESAFEDAIVSGKKLSDVLSALAQDIARLVLRTSVTAPLAKSIGDSVSGSGLFSKLFDWLPSFDVGTSKVPHDMIAKIHKDEMIIPAREAAALRAGKGAGGAFYADITVNSQGGGKEDGRGIAIAIQRQMDEWWNMKMAESMRPGNVLNPVF